MIMKTKVMSRPRRLLQNHAQMASGKITKIKPQCLLGTHQPSVHTTTNTPTKERAITPGNSHLATITLATIAHPTPERATTQPTSPTL